MSVQFDRSGSQSIAASHATSLAPDGPPVSVTCWVYFEQAPGDGETHTVWWYGQGGSTGEFFRLVAIAGTSGVKLRADLRADDTTVVTLTTTAEYPLDAWHCVSAVLEAIQGNKYRIKLYVDDDAAIAAENTPQGASFEPLHIVRLGAPMAPP
jgi:hypothetical protein